MFWSTEDHSRHHQQNYYNNFPIVQQQNGIPQTTAALPPQQSQQQQHPTPPPNIQQQQQQQQQQQHQQQQQQQQQLQQQQQQQQSSHRTAQQIPTHYTNQQLQQQHPQHQSHQWSARTSVLTAAPFFQQYQSAMPNAAQYCTAPPQYFHPHRVTQASALSAPQQQRPQQCLPPGCPMYSMPPQAAALRQNVLSQPSAAIMTPTTSSSQQMQMQYFSAPQFCQPPPPLVQQPYGHVITTPPAMPETPVVKTRKYAIPIIDPITQENIFERQQRKGDSENVASADAVASTTDTPPSTAVDQKDSDTKNDVAEESNIPLQNQSPTTEPVEEENNECTKEVEDDATDSSVHSPAVIDHVEPIEVAKEEETTTAATVVATTPTMEDFKNSECGHDHNTEQTVTSVSGVATIIEHETDDNSKCSDNNNQEPAPPNTPVAVDEYLSPPMEVINKSPTTSAKATPSKVKNKQQQTQKQAAPPPPLPPPTKPTSKRGKKNKRIKESQKKQRADLMSNENNNNQHHENKAKQAVSAAESSQNSNKMPAKVKDQESKINSNGTAGKPPKMDEMMAMIPVDECGDGDDLTEATTTSLDDQELSDKTSYNVDDSTETLNTNNEDNDETSQSYASPKLTKSEQITSEILGIEPSDENEFLFLNSSVSGYEEDFCSSPAQQDTPENEKVNDILFGDFPKENPIAEISLPKDSLLQSQEESNEAEDSQSSTPKSEKKFAYSIQALKSLSEKPASKLPPAIRGNICDIIGKNAHSSAAMANTQQSYNQNQTFHQIPFLNRKRNKRTNDGHLYQQNYPQQCEQQQQRSPEIIRINLSLDKDIELAKSENAWVPAGLQICAPKAESETDEQVLKKIRGILNKLTPENFEKLLQNAANFPINEEERMKKVMLLIFEKTVSEPNFAPTYARFCKFLFSPKNNNEFQKILFERIIEEFDSNVNNAKAKNAKLQPLMEKLAAATDPKEKLELKAELDDQEYQFRRRAWGTVRFIGEMFKLGLLNIKRIYKCVEDLLDPQCEEKLEYLCKLLTTVGPQLEQLERQATNEEKQIRDKFNTVFTKIKNLVERKKGAGQKISSRVRFMMQDVLELRSRSWYQKSLPVLPSREVSPAFTRGTSSNPRQMRTSSNYMSSGGGYDNKRRQTGDGQKNSSQQSIDVGKLSFSKDVTTAKLGNPSPLMLQTTRQSQDQHQQQSFASVSQQSNRFQSRSLETEKKESTPTIQQQQQQHKELSYSECDCLLNGLIELAIDEESKTECLSKWKRTEPAHQQSIVCHLLTDYLQSPKEKREMESCTRLFTNLFKENLLQLSTFKACYQRFSEISDEILIDAPCCWTYMFNFLGPLLHLKLIQFETIWDKKWYNETCGEKFLQQMIIHFTSEFGANYMRQFWKDNSLHWGKFMSKDKVAQFVAKNSFEFIENYKISPPRFVTRDDEDLVYRIKALLGQSEQDIDLIIDFISTNVLINCNFIRTLTIFFCDYAVIYSNTPNSSSISSNSKTSKLFDSPAPNSSSTNTSTPSYRLREDLFLTKCIPLLRRCIDSKDEHEINCLDAIVERCTSVYDTSAETLIRTMLMELCGEVISKESFEKWQQQRFQRAKGHDKLTSELNVFFK